MQVGILIFDQTHFKTQHRQAWIRSCLGYCLDQKVITVEHQAIVTSYSGHLFKAQVPDKKLNENVMYKV